MTTTLVALATATMLTFSSHAAFFSTETNQPVPLDPQVFVRDATAPAGASPQHIDHIAGLRSALLSDPADSALFSAEGAPLGFSLAQWLGAAGTLEITNLNSSAESVTVHFQRLVPHATYSLFENHFDQSPVGFTPLDGAGTSNSFVADGDGSGTLTVLVVPPMTHANAVLLVYHSDGVAHGMSRGGPGITAYHQLIARIP